MEVDAGGLCPNGIPRRREKVRKVGKNQPHLPHPNTLTALSEA